MIERKLGPAENADWIVELHPEGGEPVVDGPRELVEETFESRTDQVRAAPAR